MAPTHASRRGRGSRGFRIPAAHTPRTTEHLRTRQDLRSTLQGYPSKLREHLPTLQEHPRTSQEHLGTPSDLPRRQLRTLQEPQRDCSGFQGLGVPKQSVIMQTHTRMCILYIYTCMCVCVYIYMCAYTYIYIHMYGNSFLFVYTI